MQFLIRIGPVTLIDLHLFETTDPVAPDGRTVIRHEHYHFEDVEEPPSDDELRKLRGEDD